MSPDKTRKKRRRGTSLTATAPPRSANRVFYAVAEGRVTEYDYLIMLKNAFAERCSFRIDMPGPSSRSDKMTAGVVVKHAIDVAKDDTGGQYEEIWAIFDRDEHIDIMQAFDDVKRHNAGGRYPQIKVAFSHPSFEFWLLLHFCSFDVAQHGHSEDIVARLAAFPGFSGYGPRDKKITQARADALLPQIGTAVRNARALERQCARDRCTHERGKARQCGPLAQDPSTGMWHLLESLGVMPLLDIGR